MNTTLNTAIQNTPGYVAAQDKISALLPMGHKLEVYRRPDGETQCNWLPRRPDFKQRAIREAILPHYDAAISTFASMFGKPVWVHGSAYGNGVKVGT